MPNQSGYGQPPEKNRFQKGVSGNPSGRPKRRPTFKEELENELQALHVGEEGQRDAISKQRAIIRSLTDKAVASDMRAISAILVMLKMCGSGQIDPDQSEDDEIDLDDLEALQRYIDQRRSNETADLDRK